MLLPQEIIRKKRGGQTLTGEELEAFFHGFLAGAVADYQVGAMLMAITLKGMDHRETAELTRLMRDSGGIFTWDYPREQVVDKHSTGGVGDKTSLLLMPLAILEGLKVPMMAGRGLGHTGGTLDKLETVGFDVFLAPEDARAQVERLGGVFMGQTDKVAPLDRRLYAMRDVTATVESIPLIVASILSKKLAEGLGGLVMDVKFGSGAFIPELAEARRLAVELQAVGKECGLRVRCLLTSMDSPLGRYAGNALELYECMELLRGAGPADTRELTLELAVEMVRLAYPQRPARGVRAKLEDHLSSGRALELFLKIAEAQGADVGMLEDPATLLRARHRIPVVPKRAGRVLKVDVRQLGLAILELGGGRKLVSDRIDPWVGLSGMVRAGTALAPGEPVAVVHASDESKGKAVAKLVEAAYTVGDGDASDPLIAERL